MKTYNKLLTESMLSVKLPALDDLFDETEFKLSTGRKHKL